MPLLLIGPFLYQIGGGTEAFVDLQFRFREVNQTRGYVTDMIETRLDTDDYPVYQYNYSFPIGLETVYGTSFSSKFDLSIDQSIPIEYIVGNPSLSRIPGSSYSKIPFFAYLGLVFMLAAFIFVIIRGIGIYRISTILTDGTATLARYEEGMATSIEINEQTQYRITYTYKVGNETYYEYLSTTQPDEEENSLITVYSNSKPVRSVLARKLPYALSKRVTDLYLEQT